MLDPFDDIFISQEWNAISNFYGRRKAERSRVPLINHVREGIAILNYLDADYDTIAAYCLHPLFQNDVELNSVGMKFIEERGYRKTVFFAMEYRGIANAYLSQHEMPQEGIRLSAFKEVNDMLRADKIQNRKDFDTYHKSTHRNKSRLTEYFNEWLKALNVTETKYLKIIQILE